MSLQDPGVFHLKSFDCSHEYSEMVKYLKEFDEHMLAYWRVLAEDTNEPCWTTLPITNTLIETHCKLRSKLRPKCEHLNKFA